MAEKPKIPEPTPAVSKSTDDKFDGYNPRAKDSGLGEAYGQRGLPERVKKADAGGANLRIN